MDEIDSVLANLLIVSQLGVLFSLLKRNVYDSVLDKYALCGNLLEAILGQNHVLLPLIVPVFELNNDR